MCRVVLLGSIAVALAAVPAAGAHKPVFGVPERPLDAVTSYAMYGVVDPAAKLRYRVRVGAERRLLVELLIPDREPESARARRALPRVTLRAPDGTVLPVPAIRSPFDEPFTRTRYIRIGFRDAPAATGVYELVVGSTVRSRFVLATGWREDFGIGDTARLPAAVARVRAWYA
ncbi:MAG: hypothetical protein FJW96_11975, partial [Actinobacteria bacterium]|nr:hypothetical protein [Actinomycetota bacterium]